MSLLLGTAISMAAIGLWDDVVDLPARIRIAVHAVAVAIVLAAVSPMQTFDVRAVSISGWIPAFLLLVAGPWWVNLYNFMDGIDGSGAQTVFTWSPPQVSPPIPNPA